MGEHGTWFDYLNRFSWWRDLHHQADDALRRDWQWQLFGDTHFTLVPVLLVVTVLLFITVGAIAFYVGVRSRDGGIVPPRRMSFRHFFEYLADSVYGMVEGSMGAERAPKFFPLIGALFFFILFCNLIGLIPGFISPTDTLKTNVGIALMVFLLTHYYGVREHGLAYFKHFLGPVWWLSPLMLPIELIGHIARPVSLSMRLMGNMIADHKVVLAFFTLVPLLVPVPFMLLGVLVCIIQAFVFCTLTMVYIGMAVEHEDH
jgi:F-type H+-transporting ATPase subunit a